MDVVAATVLVAMAMTMMMPNRNSLKYIFRHLNLNSSVNCLT